MEHRGISLPRPVFSRRHLLAGVALGACGNRRPRPLHPAPSYTAFHNPRDVRIFGYSGDAMEPFLTRDGRYLLFNNRNEAPANTNLHWAERDGDMAFTYRGEIAGVNTPALEGVPSLDRDGNLFFVSNRSYDSSFSTLYRARFASGAATSPELVDGVSLRRPGWVNFDAEISAGGETLYFVDSYFGPAGHPQNASLALASRVGNSFARRPDSARILALVNQAGMVYAPCTSASELELFFTVASVPPAGSPPAIFRAARRSIAEPFDMPARVQAIDGFVEGPTLSPDDRSLYYHVRAGDRFLIRRVDR